jgi:DNA-binding response OmpR family regulator
LRKCVLVIDDDPCLQTLLQVIFELADYEVVTAENGIVGLEKLQTCKPDLILLDLMMPHMDGFTFAGEVRQRGVYASTPILVLTADACARTQARRLGFDNFFTKPFDLHQLRRRVSKLMEPRTPIELACGQSDR